MEKKLKLIDEHKLDNIHLYTTEYDYLFEPIIRSRGIRYYKQKRVTNMRKYRNHITALVEGTEKYRVHIRFTRNNIHVYCNCPYLDDTNKYCKHVYAVLLQRKLIYERERFTNIYKSYSKQLEDMELKLYNLLQYKDYLNKRDTKRILDAQNYCKLSLEDLNSLFNNNDDLSLLYSAKIILFRLNFVIKLYNNFVDTINNNIELSKKDHITIDYKFDDSKLFNEIDNRLSNLDLLTLEKAKKELSKENKSTEIVDKAIKERKRKDYIKEKQEKNYNKMLRKALFWGLVSGLAGGKSTPSDELMPWEREAILNGDYSNYNFEEEELEEDDFYYEDDK